ncbi:MAG TPA: GGDEF domain-containing protein [Gemmatimonadales bacterium]|jgi:diguanylate cyclase (GGDEF)-like protein|nr:GGDEF domain-containing protein [Gemmatimonadales bacterium]
MPAEVIPSISTLPPAFAAACRQARTDSELLERCRDVLVQRFGSDLIWFSMSNGGAPARRLGAADGFKEAVEVGRCTSGPTELVILAAASIARTMRPVAMPLATGISTVLELRSVLLERQGALDDAIFQLRALRQVARLLSSVHSTEETEHLVLDFIAEVFFAWWACLYRPEQGQYKPKRYRALDQTGVPEPIPLEPLDEALPAGGAVTDASEVAMGGLLPPGTELVIPLDAGSERIALLLLGPRLNRLVYGRAERDLAGTLSFAAAMALKNSELVERLHSAATTDELTGLFNRRALEERLEAESSRSFRHQLKTAVILIDVDHFKLINDTLGHAAGDRYLGLIGQMLLKQVRTLDVVGRLGGDEFLVILPMTSATESLVFINRLQNGLQELASQHPEFGVATLSFGIAEAPRHGRSPTAILAAADSALYAAKRGGRNLVEIAPDT